MKVKVECIPCILNARFKDLKMINAHDKEKYDYATKILENYILLLKSGMSTSRLSTELFRLIKNISKIEDPYLCEKEKENRIALIWYNDLKAKLKSMDENEKLNMAIRIAAVGNAIDPTIYTYSFKLENISKEFFTTNLTINDGLILNDVKDKKIVYLLDNCGEAVLDRLLAEVLRERGAQIVGVVKRGAFLNDVTLHEVEQIRLKDSFDKIIDTGTDAASIFWDEISEETKEEILNADIIIAKGLANFEYLSDVKDKIPCKKLHIFKVKCKAISELIGAPVNSYVAKLVP